MSSLANIFAAVLLLSLSTVTNPQTYPNRALRIVAPYPAGGTTDILARTVARELSEAWGQPAVTDNRPGASGMVGAQIVAKAAPDGYTLLMGLSTLAINPAIYRKVPYNALTDFAPVTLVLSAPNILVVHPSLPVKTVKELISFARGRPGQLSYGSSGSGVRRREPRSASTSTTSSSRSGRGDGPSMIGWCGMWPSTTSSCGTRSGT